MNTTILVHPRMEPISVADAKQFLRVDHRSEDELIEGFIKTARETVEEYTGRLLMLQTVATVIPFSEGSLKKTAGRPVFYVPKGPLQEVIKVELVSEAGELKEIPLARLHVNKNVDPALMVVDVQGGWGARLCYVGGYGQEREAVPSLFKHTILELVAQFYEHRGRGSPDLLDKCDELLSGFRRPRISL